ncbi:MAG: hypothetical protein WCI67_06120 [Chloroflexales bacterium]
MSDRSGVRGSSGHYLLAWAVYTLLSAIMLGPALAHLADRIPGGPIAAVDGYQNVWNLWWVHEALAHGKNPFVSPTPRAMALSLELRGESFQAARDLSIELDDARIGSWPFQPRATAVNLRLLVPPGAHRLTLRAPTGTDSASRRTLSIVIYTASGSWQAVE